MLKPVVMQVTLVIAILASTACDPRDRKGGEPPAPATKGYGGRQGLPLETRATEEREQSALAKHSFASFLLALNPVVVDVTDKQLPLMGDGIPALASQPITSLAWWLDVSDAEVQAMIEKELHPEDGWSHSLSMPGLLRFTNIGSKQGGMLIMEEPGFIFPPPDSFRPSALVWTFEPQIKESQDSDPVR